MDITRKAGSDTRAMTACDTAGDDAARVSGSGAHEVRWVHTSSRCYGAKIPTLARPTQKGCKAGRGPLCYGAKIPTLARPTQKGCKAGRGPRCYGAKIPTLARPTQNAEGWRGACQLRCRPLTSVRNDEVRPKIALVLL
ncbi:hypothetical protein AVEN_228984-1 [Araneus ventricosus]|uniref:Uncharacterized protein n=1 Tax=Araneus ventricosus TaxID=182803 RepID=A0A4Y2I6G2_ARAVE|nr:hypothetical protein AVEN_228984-1 [Araneus ventricosus]